MLHLECSLNGSHTVNRPPEALLGLLKFSNEIKLPVLAKQCSLTNYIASFIMLCVFPWRASTLLFHSGEESDQLGCCQSNVAWIQVFQDWMFARKMSRVKKEISLDKRVFSYCPPGRCDLLWTHHGDWTFAFPPKLHHLLGLTADVTIPVVKTLQKPVMESNFNLFLTSPIVSVSFAWLLFHLCICHLLFFSAPSFHPS